jgi:transposase InsO family protein
MSGSPWEIGPTPSWPCALCAIAIRGGNVAGVIFHTDQGGEYTVAVFAQACAAAGVRQSMGRSRHGPGQGDQRELLLHSGVRTTRRTRPFATQTQARHVIADNLEY